jgi:hypothetical protein
MLGFLIVPLVPIVLMALALSLAYVEARLPAPRGGRHPDVTQLRQPRVGAIRRLVSGGERTANPRRGLGRGTPLLLDRLRRNRSRADPRTRGRGQAFDLGYSSGSGAVQLVPVSVR